MARPRTTAARTVYEREPHDVMGRIARAFVADAPPDADEALAGIRRLPPWACLLVAVAVAAGLWAAIIAGAWALLGR